MPSQAQTSKNPALAAVIATVPANTPRTPYPRYFLMSFSFHVSSRVEAGDAATHHNRKKQRTTNTKKHVQQ